MPLTQTSALPTTPLTISFAFCPAGGAVKSVRYHHGTANCAIVSAPTLVIWPKQVFMLVEKKTFGQAPFCSSAAISVPGAPPSSLATVSQPLVEKPGVEICAPDWVAVALVSTFQPAVDAEVGDGGRSGRWRQPSREMEGGRRGQAGAPECAGVHRRRGEAQHDDPC